MPSLAELARVHTSLDDDEVAYLGRPVATWGLLADLCFADLLLFAPVTGPRPRRRPLRQPPSWRRLDHRWLKGQRHHGLDSSSHFFMLNSDSDSTLARKRSCNWRRWATVAAA